MLLTPWVVICIVPMAMQSQNAKQEEAKFINMIENMRTVLGNFRCEYEAYSAPVDENNEMKNLETITGIYNCRSDGFFHMDNYRLRQSGEPLVRETIVVFKGETKSYNGQADNPRQGSLEVTKTNTGHYFIEGTYNQAFCVDWFISLLQYNNRLVEFLGSELIDGHKCEIVQISIGAKPDRTLPEGGISNKFWIDLDNFGQPRKVEMIDSSGHVQGRVVIDRFKEFTVEGNTFSLPMSALFETFIEFDPKTRRGYTANRVTYRSLVKVLTDKCTFEKNMPDTIFLGKYVDGVVVTDRVRRMMYEYSHSIKPQSKLGTRNKSEELAELQEKLKLADEQSGELLASSWEERDANGIVWTISYVLVAMSLIGILLATLLKLRGRS